MTLLYASLSGLLIWTAQFSILYGVTAVACARGYAGIEVFGVGLVPLTVVAATVAALVLNALVLLQALSRSRALAADNAASSDRFLTHLTWSISALSAAAIAWNGLPILIVEAC